MLAPSQPSENNDFQAHPSALDFNQLQTGPCISSS